MTKDQLNQLYRDQGWGRLAEAALGIEPYDVESQARRVAQYAVAKHSAPLLDTTAQRLFAALLFTVINPDVRLCRETYDELAKVAFDAAEAFVDESRRRLR